jgi:hypothetical protein
MCRRDTFVDLARLYLQQMLAWATFGVLTVLQTVPLARDDSASSSLTLNQNQRKFLLKCRVRPRLGAKYYLITITGLSNQNVNNFKALAVLDPSRESGLLVSSNPSLLHLGSA